MPNAVLAVTMPRAPLVELGSLALANQVLGVGVAGPGAGLADHQWNSWFSHQLRG